MSEDGDNGDGDGAGAGSNCVEAGDDNESMVGIQTQISDDNSDDDGGDDVVGYGCDWNGDEGVKLMENIQQPSRCTRVGNANPTTDKKANSNTDQSHQGN
jgi:hypothetical protein